MIEGKVVNQKYKWKKGGPLVCERCQKILPPPITALLQVSNGDVYQIYTYLSNPNNYWIYETKSGRSICYCSDNCRKRHNHRFREEYRQFKEKFKPKIKAAEPTPLSEAVKILCKELKDDPEYYYGWQANIAMSVYDQFELGEKMDHEKFHQKCNDAAKQFLSLLMMDNDKEEG